MKLTSYILTVSCFCFAITFASATGDNLEVPAVPEVGLPCPDFTLSEVAHFKKKKVSLEDFKGKWAFLDFWSTTCSVCIESFKKINNIQAEFKDNVQFMLIGSTRFEYNINIRELFDKLTLRQSLNLPSAFDSTVFKGWDIHALPHIVVLDPKGTVRFITDGRDLTAEKVRALVSGQEIKLYQPGSISRVFSADETFPNKNVLYRSSLAEWNGERQSISFNIDHWLRLGPEDKAKGFNMIMAPLYMLYNHAYFGRVLWHPTDTAFHGKFHRYPLLEIQDSSRFKYDFTSSVGTGTYNYHLVLPRNCTTKENIMHRMQFDLKQVLGYQATVEKRDMPVWKLVVLSDDARNRIKTKGGEQFDSSKRGRENFAAGFSIRNQPVDLLLRMLIAYLGRMNPIQYLNCTDLTGSVDFTLEADMFDLASIRKALQKQGLDFQKGTNEMNVIVIRDGKTSLN